MIIKTTRDAVVSSSVLKNFKTKLNYKVKELHEANATKCRCFVVDTLTKEQKKTWIGISCLVLEINSGRPPRLERERCSLLLG